jgi:hypothetical protein
MNGDNRITSLDPAVIAGLNPAAINGAVRL